MNIENLHRPSSYNISPEARGALGAELPFEESIDLYLARVLQNGGKDGEETILHAIGDAYHRYLYSKISPLISGVSDRFDFPLSDYLFIPQMLYAKEILLALLSYEAVSIARSGLTPAEILNQSNELAKYTVFAAIIASATLAAFWGLNYLRTPLERKMGLERLKFDTSEEVDFVIRQLNMRDDVHKLGEEEFTQELFKAVDKFLGKIYGYSTPTTERIKPSRWSESLIRLGRAGWANVFFQEIIDFGHHFDADKPHEILHLKGVAGDSQAQFGGIISLVESNHPYLQYLGYRLWLYLLVNIAAEEWMRDHQRTEIFDYIDYLREKGLNERTREEIRERDVFVVEKMSEFTGLTLLINKLLSKRMPFFLQNIYEILRKKAPNLVYLIEHPKQVYEVQFMELIFRLFIRKDIANIYLRSPLMVLHSYRMQRLEGLNS